MDPSDDIAGVKEAKSICRTIVAVEKLQSMQPFFAPRKIIHITAKPTDKEDIHPDWL